MEYSLKDIEWYYTNKGFEPFIVNKDKTKLKLFSSGDICPIIEYDGTVFNYKNMIVKVRNDRQDKSEFAKWKTEEVLYTLEKVIGEKGVLVAPVDVFKYYYFKEGQNTDYGIYKWIQSTIATDDDIKNFASKIFFIIIISCYFICE